MTNHPELRGHVEARLLEVERGLLAFGRDLQRRKRDLTELQQRLWDEDIHRKRGVASPTPTPTPNTTWLIAIQSCIFSSGATGNYLAGDVVITKTSGGAVLFTGSITTKTRLTCNFYLDVVSDLTISVTQTESARFTSTPLTISATSVAPGDALDNSVTAVVASGYHAPNVASRYPLADTLTFTDSRFGVATATYSSSSGGRWIGTLTDTVFGFSETRTYTTTVPSNVASMSCVRDATATGVTETLQSGAVWPDVGPLSLTYRTSSAGSGWVVGDTVTVVE
jgi:hypothetical protein